MRLRLILSFVLIVIVSIASVVIIFRFGAQREVGAFMFRGGMTGGEDLVDALESYYSTHRSWQGVETILGSTSGHRMGPGRQSGQGMGMMGQRLRLANADGSIVFDTSLQQPTGSLSQEQLSQAIPLKSGWRTAGYLLLEGGAAFTAGDQTALLARLTRAAMTAAVIGAGFSLILAVMLTYRLMQPIHDLRRGAQALSAGKLSQRVAVSGDGELASLGRAFNRMAESLQNVEESRRAMTADIAHELRTPLAVQRAHLEAIQDGVYPLDVENLDPILAQNLLLTRLVEDLRTLALAEAGQLTLDKAPVDLPHLVQRVIERFTPQAANSDIRLVNEQRGTNIPTLELDAGRIEQILNNLITNALRFTQPGGRIVLSLEQDAGAVHLSVHDSGPGIPEHALPHVFERFYRTDQSRSREAGGSGLGLSIARQLARAHGGSLAAANHPRGGAVFTLSLPK